MVKRSITTVLACLAGCLLMGSVVFTGLHGIAGKWRLVELYGTDVAQFASPVTLEFDKRGVLVGHSSCGLFTGSWRACENGLRIKDLVPSTCACGELRTVERKLLDAMGEAEQHRLEKNQLVLMHHGKRVALLVPVG
ncbi:MAG: META domain-containing protein [Flavobacteriales bacterium]